MSRILLCLVSQTKLSVNDVHSESSLFSHQNEPACQIVLHPNLPVCLQGYRVFPRPPRCAVMNGEQNDHPSKYRARLSSELAPATQSIPSPSLTGHSYEQNWTVISIKPFGFRPLQNSSTKGEPSLRHSTKGPFPLCLKALHAHDKDTRSCAASSEVSAGA